MNSKNFDFYISNSCPDEIILNLNLKINNLNQFKQYLDENNFPVADYSIQEDIFSRYEIKINKDKPSELRIYFNNPK